MVFQDIIYAFFLKLFVENLLTYILLYCELPDRVDVSYIICCLNLSVYFLLTWLTDIAKEISLTCYLTDVMRDGFIFSPTGFEHKVSVRNSTGIRNLFADFLFWVANHPTTSTSNSDNNLKCEIMTSTNRRKRIEETLGRCDLITCILHITY